MIVVVVAVVTVITFILYMAVLCNCTIVYNTGVIHRTTVTTTYGGRQRRHDIVHGRCRDRLLCCLGKGLYSGTIELHNDRLFHGISNVEGTYELNVLDNTLCNIAIGTNIVIGINDRHGRIMMGRCVIRCVGRTGGTIVIPRRSVLVFNPVLDERYIVLLLLLLLRTVGGTGIKIRIDNRQCDGIGIRRGQDTTHTTISYRRCRNSGWCCIC